MTSHHRITERGKATPDERLEQAFNIMSPRFSESGFCGFSPPDGWLELVLEIHERLLLNPEYRIGQVKEKFAGLRFYADGLTEEEYEYVYAKEHESYEICQVCGIQDGTVEIRNSGWGASLCQGCANG